MVFLLLIIFCSFLAHQPINFLFFLQLFKYLLSFPSAGSLLLSMAVLFFAFLLYFSYFALHFSHLLSGISYFISPVSLSFLFPSLFILVSPFLLLFVLFLTRPYSSTYYSNSVTPFLFICLPLPCYISLSPLSSSF